MCCGMLWVSLCMCVSVVVLKGIVLLKLVMVR